MRKIQAREFIKLWEKIAELEQLSDREMCSRLGISPLNPTYWRTGKTSAIRPRTLRLLSEILHYEVATRRDGTFILPTDRPRRNILSQDVDAEESRSTASDRHSLLAPLAEIEQTGESISIEQMGQFSPLRPSDLEGSSWYRIKNDSLGPIFLRGDCLLLGQEATPAKPGFAIVFTKGNRRSVLCRILSSRGILTYRRVRTDKQIEDVDSAFVLRVFPVIGAFFGQEQSYAGRPAGRSQGQDHSGKDARGI